MGPEAAPSESVPRDVVDAERLARFLAQHLPDLAGPFSLRRLGEGQSNLTLLVRGQDWEVVLRRPPRGDLPPTAHDVRREYRVIRALWEARAPVPVPRPVALCEDSSVIGAPFYLMEKVDGVAIRRRLPRGFSSHAHGRPMGEQLVNRLVALHGVDYRAVGLEGFGKPAGFLERQLQRMRALWDRARFRDVPEIEEVGAWLGDHLPPQSGTTIVHGDYKLDNVLFSPAPPVRLVALVDWELSTLGDPLCDVGWMLYFWRERGEAAIRIPVATVTDQPGFPTRSALREQYAAATGRGSDDLRWYVALAGWKIAIIMEGSYRRYRAGIADHPSFAALEQAVPDLSRRALAAITGDLVL